MLSMYAKCLAKCRRGTHFASILPRRPSFSVRIPQIMHSGQILPLFFDLSFVRELCDSCLRGSSGRDRHHGSTFTGALACPLREGANAVARPLCGGVSVAVRPLRGGSSAVARPLRGSTSAVICPLLGGASIVVCSLCRNASAATKKSRVVERRLPWQDLAAVHSLGGKSWHYFVAMHFPKGHIGAATESYRAGNAITNTAPPSGALNAVTVPSKLSTISFTMASPRPAPPLLRAREASLR